MQTHLPTDPDAHFTVARTLRGINAMSESGNQTIAVAASMLEVMGEEVHRLRALLKCRQLVPLQEPSASSHTHAAPNAS